MTGEIAIEPENYMTARAYCLTAAFWFAVATSFGILAACYLIAPDFMANIAFLEFGRIRPIHVNLVLFGFVTPGLLAAAHYFLPRLMQTRLYSQKLGLITVLLWNVAVTAGMIGLSLGHTTGREYAELMWPVKILIVIGFGLIGANLFLTIRQRKEPILYVSVWYVCAAVVMTGATYFIGNVVWEPETGALLGITDAVLLWFYGHNIFGLLLTPLALAVAYYVIPKVTHNPLYSHSLSILGFWGLLVVYTHIGTHHLLQVPVPTWLKVIAIVDSVAMVIPVMVFLINIWYTAKGKLGDIHADIAGKFIFTGTIMYFFVSIQGSMMALPNVQRVTHFTNWVIGHSHIGVLGFAGMISLGGMYYILPRITDKPLYSRFLADLQYWLILIGVVGFTIVLTIAGLIQGNAWLNGETIYRVLPEIHIYYVIRLAIGIFIVIAAYIGLYNIIRTLYLNPGVESCVRK
jgi:cytochrome c oxidase cbb3-type subunit 1/cytochrome c oxidase cbb3-type subunit I/II